MTGSTSAQTLTINGSGFQSGTGLELLFIPASGSTITVPSTAISFVSSSELQVSIIVGTVAESWSVKVVNPSGLTSNAVSFVVNAPAAATAPVIASLNPTSLAGTNSYQTLTINGSGFQSGTGLEILITYPGGSTTVTASQISFVSSSQLKLSIDVGTTARTLTLQVVDPNGQKSNTASIAVL
jgi:hypothetical protein